MRDLISTHNSFASALNVKPCFRHCICRVLTFLKVIRIALHSLSNNDNEQQISLVSMICFVWANNHWSLLELDYFSSVILIVNLSFKIKSHWFDFSCFILVWIMYFSGIFPFKINICQRHVFILFCFSVKEHVGK